MTTKFKRRRNPRKFVLLKLNKIVRKITELAIESKNKNLSKFNRVLTTLARSLFL